MISADRINSHDRIVTRAAESITNLFSASWDRILDSLLNQLDTLTIGSVRTTVLNTAPSSNAIGQLILPVLEDQSAMLELPGNTGQDTAMSLASSAAIVSEYNSSTEAFIAAMTLLLLSSDTRNRNRTIRTLVDQYRARSTRTIQDTVVVTDAAYGIFIMRNAGVERFTYRGGLVAGSREFCRSHNNRTYTEAEIRRIWSSQTWGGKRPGDPFVTRGGYNCRHYWVPAEE